MIFFRTHTPSLSLRYSSAHALGPCSDQRLSVCFPLCRTLNLQLWLYTPSNINMNSCISWYIHNSVLVSWRGFPFILNDRRPCWRNDINTADQSGRGLVFNFNLRFEHIYSTANVVLGLQWQKYSLPAGICIFVIRKSSFSAIVSWPFGMSFFGKASTTISTSIMILIPQFFCQDLTYQKSLSLLSLLLSFPFSFVYRNSMQWSFSVCTMAWRAMWVTLLK